MLSQKAALQHSFSLWPFGVVLIIYFSIIWMADPAVDRRWLIQLLVLPAFLWWVHDVKLYGVRLPRKILWIVLGLVAVNLIMHLRVELGRSSASTLITRLTGDPHGAFSRVLTDEIGRQRFDHEPIPLSNLTYDIDGVSKLIDNKVGLVVWGDAQRLNLTLDLGQDLLVRDVLVRDVLVRDISDEFNYELSLAIPEPLRNLIIVKRSSNTVIIPTQPLFDTAGFIADLSMASSEYRTSASREFFELDLRAVAFRKAAWRHNAHRAFVYWMAGTILLENAIAGSKIDQAQLMCATRNFRSAQKNVPPGSNGELQRAILNNDAIVRTLYGLTLTDMTQIAKLHRAVQRHLTKAATGGAALASIAKHNLQLINEVRYVKPGKKRKRRGNRSPRVVERAA